MRNDYMLCSDIIGGHQMYYNNRCLPKNVKLSNNNVHNSGVCCFIRTTAKSICLRNDYRLHPDIIGGH